MRLAPLPAPDRSPNHRRHHRFLPLKALHAHRDWGEQALQRTWRTVGTVSLLLGLANAFVARVPAVLFMLAGIWAHFKGNPKLRDKLAAQPVLGAPLRWWLHRGRHIDPSVPPDTSPQQL